MRPNCFDCGNKLSENTKTCPNCGSENPFDSNKVPLILDKQIINSKEEMLENDSYFKFGSLGIYSQENLYKLFKIILISVVCLILLKYISIYLISNNHVSKDNVNFMIIFILITISLWFTLISIQFYKDTRDQISFSNIFSAAFIKNKSKRLTLFNFNKLLPIFVNYLKTDFPEKHTISTRIQELETIHAETIKRHNLVMIGFSFFTLVISSFPLLIMWLLFKIINIEMAFFLLGILLPMILNIILNVIAQILVFKKQSIYEAKQSQAIINLKEDIKL